MSDRNPMDLSAARAGYDALAGVWEWASHWKLKSRTLFLFGEVGGPLAREPGRGDIEIEIRKDGTSDLIAALLYLDSVSSDPIRLLINSPGGEVMAGMALIQTMRDLRSEVHTFVVGMAASMAAAVSVSGARRLAYPAARWLLHRSREKAEGDPEDLDVAAKELKIIDAMVDYVIVGFTKIPADRLRRMQRKDRWMGAEEALKWGLVDEIVTPSRGPAVWVPDKAFFKTLREKEEEEEGREP